MSILLQNTHYNRVAFDDKISLRTLKLYINSLDSDKIFFTQEDIDQLEKSYANKLDDILLKAESSEWAKKTYALYEQRVEERITFACELLKQSEIDLTSNTTLKLNRADTVSPTLEGWPADLEASNILWKKRVADAYITEKLRRKALKAPSPNALSIEDLLSLHFKQKLMTVKEADEEVISDYLLGAVAAAYGPHSDYFSPREMQRFIAELSSEFVGIGAEISDGDDGYAYISGICIDGPADKQGDLQPDDRIIAVDPLNNGNFIDTMYLDKNRVVDLIRGKKDTKVALKLLTPGSHNTKSIVIPRGKVQMPNARASGFILKFARPDKSIKNIGLIILPSFYSGASTSCSDDVHALLTRMNKEQVHGLILDLRTNGGGSLKEVQRMASFFIGSGPVVQVKNRLGQVKVLDNYESSIFDKPMICLVDKSSASASEILAALLQDYNRAIIAGSKSTFGKGTVQVTIDVARMMPFFSRKDCAGHLKPTTQKFYRVNGQSTQHSGVESDIVIPSQNDAYNIGEKYLFYALPHDSIQKAKHYKPFPRNKLFVPTIREKSIERIESDRDFQYICEDIAATREKLMNNTASLNLEVRERELAKLQQNEKQRSIERKSRHKAIQERDNKSLTIYQINLNDPHRSSLHKTASLKSSQRMRRSLNENASRDSLHQWPSHIDPAQRESIHILSDLIALTDQSGLNEMKKS